MSIAMMVVAFFVLTRVGKLLWAACVKREDETREGYLDGIVYHALILFILVSLLGFATLMAYKHESRDSYYNRVEMGRTDVFQQGMMLVFCQKWFFWTEHKVDW